MIPSKQIVPITIRVTMSSEEDNVLEYTAYVEVDAAGWLAVECPACQFPFRTSIAAVQSGQQVRCPGCGCKEVARDFLLARHDYVLDEVRRIAFRWVSERVANTFEKAFRGSKHIKFTRR